MKNIQKEGQKLPVYGIGPYLVTSMVLITLTGILCSGSFLKSGILQGVWMVLFRIIGVIFITAGAWIWYKSAFSDIDEKIKDNQLKTDGLYAYCRNPIYAGIWMALSGVSLLWGNLYLLVCPVINYLIMTLVVVLTEEKWLKDLYGQQYTEYMKQVNRFIPVKRR